MQTFDLIVIGTGAGGSVAAHKCAKAGWKVAQIDSLPFGGTCALRGCDPKKVLVGAAEMIDWNQRMKGKGVHSDAKISWNELMEFKRTFTKPVPDKRNKSMEKAGIKSFHGRTCFLDEERIEINGKILKAKKFLIAAGAKPKPIPIKGFNNMITSTDFLELEELPETVLFVGGGFISFEFAHIAARAGKKVHIIHRGEMPLTGFDTDMVKAVLLKAKQIGITVHLNTEVQTVEKFDNQFEVSVKVNGQIESVNADLVVHGAGRVPDIDDMKLDKGNVDRTKKGIKVNDYLQSVSNPAVYAAGDATDTDGLPLTPVAGFESHIVASNMLEGNAKKAEYPAQPAVVFTIPPLAMVGLTEQQAREKGYDVKISFNITDDWYASRRTNEQHTGFKTIINKENGQIIGAHILGNNAEEIINLYAMAINQNLKATELKKMIYAYPSHASDIPYMV